MGVSGQADLRSLWQGPKVQSLALRSHGLTLEGVLAAPPRSRLPKGAVLRGPFSLSASGSGSAAEAKVEAALDLTPATLLVPSLHKPAGTALTPAGLPRHAARQRGRPGPDGHRAPGPDPVPSRLVSGTARHG